MLYNINMHSIELGPFGIIDQDFFHAAFLSHLYFLAFPLKYADRLDS